MAMIGVSDDVIWMTGWAILLSRLALPLRPGGYQILVHIVNHFTFATTQGYKCVLFSESVNSDISNIGGAIQLLSILKL